MRVSDVYCAAPVTLVGEGEVKLDSHYTTGIVAYMDVHPLHITMLITSDVNALYIFDGAVSGSSRVAESRCCIYTSELTNRGGSLHKYVSNAPNCECRSNASLSLSHRAPVATH